MKCVKCTFMALVIGTLSFCSNKNHKKNIRWRETIGIRDPDFGYKNAKLHYSVNDTPYTGSFPHSLSNQLPGEKYTMRYNIDNPEETEIDYWNPVFEVGEKTSFFVTKIVEIKGTNIFSPWPLIVFRYTINGKQIENYYYLPSNYKILYPNLHQGQCYEVECWNENFWRAKIHFDKQIKDTTNAK